MSSPVRLMIVVGARPNFMKVAPIISELRRAPGPWVWRLVHTGQHYDAQMSSVFFDELGMPRPDVDLGVGSGSHAQQTAAIMSAFEPVLLDWRPDLLLVVGDVNSTLACALVASKIGVRVAHVEAGLRSFDRTMPEEINRVLTDQLSDLLFVTEESAIENLAREGHPRERIHFVGNVMIDTLLAHRDEARARRVPARFGLSRHGYALVTLHRPANVDAAEALDALLAGIEAVAADYPVVFPVHPRSHAAIARSPRALAMVRNERLTLVQPLGYLEFIGLLADAAVVLTDSGGVQEESTVMGVPCLTLRTNTERPATITHGTNRLAGVTTESILSAWAGHLSAPRTASVPPLWDGWAARRIVDILWRDAMATHPAARAAAV